MEKVPNYNGKPVRWQELIVLPDPTPPEYVVLDGPGSHPVYGEPQEEPVPCPTPAVEEPRGPTQEL